MENCTWANRILYVWLGLLLALPMRAQMLFTLIDNTEYFCNFVLGNHRYICFVSY